MLTILVATETQLVVSLKNRDVLRFGATKSAADQLIERWEQYLQYKYVNDPGELVGVGSHNFYTYFPLSEIADVDVKPMMPSVERKSGKPWWKFWGG